MKPSKKSFYVGNSVRENKAEKIHKQLCHVRLLASAGLPLWHEVRRLQKAYEKTLKLT